MSNLSVKIAEDKLQLKIGEEICSVSVVDGYTDDVSLIIKSLQIKSAELIRSRQTRDKRDHVEAKKNLAKDIKNIDVLLAIEMKSLKGRSDAV